MVQLENAAIVKFLSRRHYFKHKIKVRISELFDFPTFIYFLVKDVSRVS